MTGDDNRLLDQSERLTDRGIALLRIASGVFFLLPGIFKIVMPADFLAMTTGFPDWLQPHIGWLFTLVIVTEVLGGLMLIVGFNVRLAVVPLVLVTVVAEALVVINDHGSSLRLLSVCTHYMGAGLYASMLLLGSGGWSFGKRGSVLHWLAARPEGRLQRLAHNAVSGASRNLGLQIIRASVAIPFIAAFILGNQAGAYQDALFDNAMLRSVALTTSLLGGLALIIGFQSRAVGWLLALLALVHLIFVGLPDTGASQIGFINILFHLLIIAAVVSLRLMEFGSALEVEHILSQDKRNVVVIGGGFAGTQLVRTLEKQLPADWQTVLISEENYTTFNPMLAEVVGASVLPSHVIAPIRRMVRRTRFISAKVTQVDTQHRRVHFDGEERSGVIGFEHLVFAFGTRANVDLVPGMREHAMPFKLLGDALRVRNRVIAQMEKADQESDAVRRRFMGHFIVVGAGFSGVEVGGAIQDFIRSSQKHYPRLHDDDLKVSIIHRKALPLQELPESLGVSSLARMNKRGINMVMEAGVDAVDARGVKTSDGDRIDGATVICTIGTQPNPLIDTLDVAKQRGRIVVDADMSVAEHKGLWAIGDCALIPNAHDQSSAPPTAQFAIREGQQVAHNIAAAINGRPTRVFSYKSKGSMATIGHLTGVAELFGMVRLGGFPAWLVWRAFYLSLMPTFAKRTRIFFEWTWSMLFSPDIINLRFTTTQQASGLRRESE
jgi:NADH dehydrogenase